MEIEMREVITLNKEEYEAYCTVMAIIYKIHCDTKDSALSSLTMNLWQSLKNLNIKYFSTETKGVR